MVERNIFSINRKYTLKLSFSIEDVKHDWDLVTSKNLYLNSDYLVALENGLTKHIEFVYVIIYIENQPSAKFYFQHISLTKSFLNQKKMTSILFKNKYFKTLTYKTKGSLLVCGNFFATGANGFVFNNNIDISTRTFNQILTKILGILKVQSIYNKPNFFLIKEFYENQSIEQQKKWNNSFSKFNIDVNMILTINPEWNSFDQYLQAMVSKYRTRAKNIEKKTKNITVKKLQLSDLKLHQLKISSLYNAVLDKVDFNVVKLNSGCFYELKKQLGDDFIFTGYFHNNIMVAFSTAFISNACLYANYVGLDNDFNHNTPIYQKVLLDYVKLAIEKKVVELHLGRTAETIKSAVGAIPVEMNLYVKQTNKMFNILLKPIVKYIKPSEYVVRQPFKNKN